jgi:hypothetical protein
MTAAAGGAIEAGQLAAQMAGALKIDQVTARDTIAELVAERLLADEAPRVGLTDAGQARYSTRRKRRTSLLKETPIMPTVKVLDSHITYHDSGVGEPTVGRVLPP